LSEKISDKIVRNTVFNTIGKFWGLIIAFALTPYIIGHIGTDMYGVWAIATSLTGYFGLLDFGIKDSYTKYISEFYAKKDYRSINQLINTGIVFYIAFMAAIIALAYVSMGFIISLFHVSAAMYDDAFFIFMIAIVTFALTNILNAFDAIQSGLQRMDITNKLSIIISIVMAAGTVFFIENGYGIRGLMVNNLIVLLISELACIVIAYKIFPYLRINPLMITKDMFKRLISFGYKLQLARAADTVTFQADRILIAFFLNYADPTRMQSSCRGSDDCQPP
jgi:O-antigen/teichoic acid export membrane protein